MAETKKCDKCGRLSKPNQAVSVEALLYCVEQFDNAQMQLKKVIDGANEARDEEMKPLMKAFDEAVAAYSMISQARKSMIAAYAALNVRPS